MSDNSKMIYELGNKELKPLVSYDEIDDSENTAL